MLPHDVPHTSKNPKQTEPTSASGIGFSQGR